MYIMNMAENFDATVPQPNNDIDNNPEANKSKPNLMAKIKKFLNHKPSENQQTEYDKDQAKLLQDRLADARQDYQQMLDELTREMKPEKAKIFQDKLQQNDPVLMKTLSLYLLDKYNFGTAQKNIEIKKHNRELTNLALKKGEEAGKDHLPEIDIAAKSEKVALFKNLDASFDFQMRKAYGGKVDKRAEVAFANKDLNIALRPEPLFIPHKLANEAPESVLTTKQSDKDILEAVAAGSRLDTRQKEE